MPGIGVWLLACALGVPAPAQTRSGAPVATGAMLPAAATLESQGLPPSGVQTLLPQAPAPQAAPLPNPVLLQPEAPAAQALALRPPAFAPAPLARSGAARAPPAGRFAEPGRDAPRGGQPTAREALAAPLPESLQTATRDVPAGSLKADADADFARRSGEGSGARLNVLMVGAESVPYAKTGGLADVVDAVSRGLVQKGHAVTLVLPKYRQLDAEKHHFRPTDIRVQVPVGGELVPARLWQGYRGGVRVVLLENDGLHSPESYYAPRKPGYSDDDERFIFLTRGALEAAKALDFRPDVVHAHDWHGALTAPMLKLLYQADPFFAAAKSVLTLHNLAYQGMFPKETLLRAGFGLEDFTWQRLEYWGHFNFLKAGLAFADALTTVSPTYARQIQESNEFGRGLEGLLRFRAADLSGILNGVDPQLYDPATDRLIARPYEAADVSAGKAANKAALQAKAGLALDPEAPLFAVASRFDAQKGLDLVAEAIPGLVERGAQVVITGSGDPKLTEAFRELALRYPGSVFVHPFSETFVHEVYAAADFVLMPSRFEPCGLTQLISQAYGTLPVVARTGGLADTITDISDDEKRGDGFFMREFSAAGLLEAADRAIAHGRREAAFLHSRRTAMEKDSSWPRAIEQYERLFTRLLARLK